MNNNELNNDLEKLQEGLEILALLRDLPERYFELMNEGSTLAKEAKYSEAVEKFAAARKEGSRIVQRLLELPKSSSATMWQVLALIWSFKLIKCVFYWLLARSEEAENPTEREKYLIAAAGAQLLGHDMTKAFETLDEHLTGPDRDLLPLLAEAIRNFEERQRILEKTLTDHGIEPNLL